MNGGGGGGGQRVKGGRRAACELGAACLINWSRGSHPLTESLIAASLCSACAGAG